MKCVDCKHCINEYDGFYWCNINGEWEFIEECIANDDNLPCDLYEPDCNDDFTERP